MKRGARFITIALTSTVLVGAFLAAASGSAGAATPKCFGKKATIVGTNKADVLKGTAKADVIVGLGGNDKVKALGGDDLICGGKGNDKLYGGPDWDHIWGDVGNDQLFSQGGNDNLWGYLGNDTLDGSGSGTDDWAWFTDAPNGVNVDLSTGRATGEGTDKLIEIEGLVGSDHDDTLTGDENYNFFQGLEGDDSIDGGGGLQDLVVYWWARGPVAVDLTAGTATGEGTDTLTGIEWVGGGDFNDTISGDANPNYIWGNAGNDTISTLDGDDSIWGWDGDDTIDAGNGTDTVDGGPGTDSCLNGEDVINCES
jgi:Ca2+-binding RTX toxin-like protein